MNDDKLICAFMLTCNRPVLLGRAIRGFEKQTYENRFLIILDDLGQYKNMSGDRWQLISIPQRCLSLGEKNNMACSLAPRNVWGYAKMDDDDLYMPWHLEATVEALSRGEFVQPRIAIDYWDKKWIQTETWNRRDKNHFCYHGQWGYSRELYKRVGGYRGCYAGDDGEFQTRLLKLGVRSVDRSPDFKPSYWYNRPLPNRISEAGGSEDAYWNMGHNYSYVGTPQPWEDESVWDVEIPTEVIRRPW